jgi:DNA-binding transcriptional ArsR family regulator
MSPTRRKSVAGGRTLRTPRELRGTVSIFAALGDDVRLALVGRLASRGPLSTMRLSEGAAVTRQAVSKHLDVLEEAGIVRSMRSGRERVWEVDSEPLHAAQKGLELISRDWDRALARLKAFVED